MTEVLGGKAALVTGGSRGIGEAIALRLAADGADVAVTYQHSADLAHAVVDRVRALGRQAVALQADAGDPAAVAEAVRKAAAELGRLDILVNNAGVFPSGPLTDVGLEDFDQVLAVNVRGPFVAAQVASGYMTEGGRIINIGSCLAGRTPFPGITLYALSKTALTGLTKGLARDLGSRGITANVVHPGPIDTDMNPADAPGADAQSAYTALGHYGEPADIAATVAHLAGEGGRYITGASIAVDGGVTT
ncbi:3-oxoacyl-ACP reductase family protein [Nonomuraea sediminis]|uniref:3-oxoacyl-ACP reductase family protein n=1 Tax=Nonomuraea sediminis TaxID=2835864 RepID=UPI001BDC4C62|nr:3-oxoacyl-ACP reductase family protein [Nonomuraea sediminis]